MRLIAFALVAFASIPMASHGRTEAHFRQIDALNVFLIPANPAAVSLLLLRAEADDGKKRVLAKQYHESIIQNLTPLLFGDIRWFQMRQGSAWGTNVYEAVFGPGRRYYEIQFVMPWTEAANQTPVKCAASFYRHAVSISQCVKGLVQIKFVHESGDVLDALMFSRQEISRQMRLPD